jgi:tRNA(Ile2) C34 agmatinyltransferase TiaS
MEKKKEAQPKYIPVRCPVCNGHMTVSYGKYPCKACNSRGWIAVPPKEDYEPN